MAWVREGKPPEQIKVSFIVSMKEHPELAQFILALPYRGTSKALRDILSNAVKAAWKAHGAAHGAALEPVVNKIDVGGVVAKPETRPSDGQPDQGDVSTAAAGIIERFDKMFPS